MPLILIPATTFPGFSFEKKKKKIKLTDKRKLWNHKIYYVIYLINNIIHIKLRNKQTNWNYKKLDSKINWKSINKQIIKISKQKNKKIKISKEKSNNWDIVIAYGLQN